MVWNQSGLDMVECLGTLSCWTVNSYPRLNFVADQNKFVSRVALYLAPSFFPQLWPVSKSLLRQSIPQYDGTTTMPHCTVLFFHGVGQKPSVQPTIFYTTYLSGLQGNCCQSPDTLCGLGMVVLWTAYAILREMKRFLDLWLILGYPFPPTRNRLQNLLCEPEWNVQSILTKNKSIRNLKIWFSVGTLITKQMQVCNQYNLPYNYYCSIVHCATPSIDNTSVNTVVPLETGRTVGWFASWHQISKNPEWNRFKNPYPVVRKVILPSSPVHWPLAADLLYAESQVSY